MTGEYDISNCTTLALPLPCSALPYTFFFGKQAAPYRMGGNEVLGLGASLSYSGYPTRCAPGWHVPCGWGARRRKPSAICLGPACYAARANGHVYPGLDSRSFLRYPWHDISPKADAAVPYKTMERMDTSVLPLANGFGGR